MAESNKKDGMKGENMSEKWKEEEEESDCGMRQDNTSLLCGVRRIGRRGGDAAVAIVGVRQMREGAEAGNVEVILSNCTAMTRVHVFGSVFAGAIDAEKQLT